MIYLYGIVPGKYEPLFPCVVVRDVPEDLAFHLMADRAAALLRLGAGAAEPTLDREYATVEVKQRLHQRRFRELVVSAYRVTCAMCALRHGELLDAAHILADKDERGRPEVPNEPSFGRKIEKGGGGVGQGVEVPMTTAGSA